MDKVYYIKYSLKLKIRKKELYQSFKQKSSLYQTDNVVMQSDLHNQDVCGNIDTGIHVPS